MAFRRGGAWSGVLIQGSSGAGKSELALRLMARGWRLVADDRTVVWRSGGRVFGRAPGTLTGLIEARGVGVVACPALPYAALACAVLCETAPERIERVPLEEVAAVAGVRLPMLRLDAHAGAAAEKLQLWATSRGSRCSGVFRDRRLFNSEGRRRIERSPAPA